jgi:hypothetical protein
VRYAPQVFWLGVESDGLAKGLTDLFQADDGEFAPRQFADRYGVDPDELSRYTSNSMLFDNLSDGRIRFRLGQRHVIPALMHELARRFEEALLERDGIDTSHSDYASYPSGFVEYHTVGRVFRPRDTYALNLLAYVRQQLADVPFTHLAVVDSDPEQALIDLVPAVFENVKAIRVVNHYGEPLLSPFDEITAGDRVMVLVDLVNTGAFLKSTLALFHRKLGIPVEGVYAFVVDSAFHGKGLFDLGLINADGCFAYYLQKKLRKFEPANRIEDRRRFAGTTSEAYLLFWRTVQELATCHRVQRKHSIRVQTNTGSPINADVIRTFDINFRPHRIGEAIDTGSPYYLFLQRAVTEYGITAAVIPDDCEPGLLCHMLNLIHPDLKTCIVNRLVPVGLEVLSGHTNIAIFCVGSNIGVSLSQLAAAATKHIGTNGIIHAFPLFCRSNGISASSRVASECADSVSKTIASVQGFYGSHLPYYLLERTAAGREHFETALSEVLPMPLASIVSAGTGGIM